MSTNQYPISIWSAGEYVTIPAKASTTDIVLLGQPSLSVRDRRAILSGLESESYEMVSTFVWTKAIAALKKQLATLGMEFVGEMLGRPDITDESDPSTTLGDHDSIALAEDLGMITSTQALRLKQAMQLVTHFANLDQDNDTDEYMEREEAILLLKTCVTSVLGKPRFEAAVYFADFRKALSERTLKQDDSDVKAIMDSPYFFIRTTLSVLLSLAKTAKAANLQHAISNTILLLPQFWNRLRAPEKWQVGQAYAEVNAAGNRLATAGLKKALINVHGFDYVPESLRSNTFTEAAARVLNAHFEVNNFYNEEAPMSHLANLGTAIPKPAFAKCLEATLAVWLGNAWGHSWAALPYSEKILKSLGSEQWDYYINECFARDRIVLDKLISGEKPVTRWRELVSNYKLGDYPTKNKHVKLLMAASVNGAASTGIIMRRAQSLREQMQT